MATSYLRVNETYARTIVVGDIHGCMDELQLLLAGVAFGPADLLVAVGDLIDRGPASWDVARFFRYTPNAVSVLGNHDRRVAGTVRGTSQPALSQKQSLALLSSHEREDWASWLEILPAVIETDHAIVTHARLDPTRALDNQDAFHTCAVGGPMVVIENDDRGIPLWYRNIGVSKPLCIGHLKFDRVELVPGQLFALDTGCVKGGALTAAIFPGGHIVSVPATRNYYVAAKRAWTRDDEMPFHTVAPADWPLHAVADVLKREAPLDDAELEAIRERVLLLAGSLGIEKRLPFLKASLNIRFGAVPTDGPDKGAYFLRVKDSFQKRENKALANTLLRGRSPDIVQLAGISPKTRLGELNKFLDDFTAEICSGGF